MRSPTPRALLLAVVSNLGLESLCGMAGLDIFISYSGKDRQWAVWLDGVVREAGHRTTVQEYDFLPGQDFVEAIDQALTRNQYVVCLLSQAYRDSRWCAKEWHAALCGEKQFLLRIGECELDGLLAPHAYVDLVGLAEAEVKERVVTALAKLDGRDPRPSTPVPFPSTVPVSTRARQIFPGILPAIWNIPEARNPHFTGRDEALRRLHEDLRSGKQAAITQAISGLGGVGKTQLALEYAYRHASDYEGVWWLRAETPATLADDYAGLAPFLGLRVLTVDDHRKERRSDRRAHDRLMDWTHDDPATPVEQPGSNEWCGRANRLLYLTCEIAPECE